MLCVIMQCSKTFFSWASCVLLLSSVQNHTHERIQLLNSSGLCSVSGQQQPVAVSISSLQTGGSSVGALSAAVFDFMGSSLSLISFCSHFSGQTLSALWWCGKCCDCIHNVLLSCEYGQSVDGQHWCEVVLFCALCSCGQSRCWVLNGKADSSVCELMGYSSCWPVGGDLATLHPHRRLWVNWNVYTTV